MELFRYVIKIVNDNINYMYLYERSDVIFFRVFLNCFDFCDFFCLQLVFFIGIEGGEVMGER